MASGRLGQGLVDTLGDGVNRAHAVHFEQLSLRREKRQAVRRALAALPEHYRIALVLFEIEGYSYETISEILKVPAGTVKSRINRARTALATGLGQQEELFSGASSQI